MTEITQEKTAFKKKKFFNKNKPKKPNVNNHINKTEQYDDSEQNFEPNTIINTDEYKIFHMIQSRTNINQDLFWDTLNRILKTNTFDKILRNDMNLISYAILYEKTEIFDDLLNNYGLLISKANMEQSMLKLCYNKNPGILSKVLEFYKKNHDNPNELFTNTFINNVTKSSYREENNNLILDWLSYNINKEQMELFWKELFNNKNIPLILTALKHDKTEYKDYLKTHINQFESLIKTSGREHTIYQSFSTTPRKESNLELSEGSEENNFNLTIESKSPKTEIIVKKKKKIL